MVRKALELQPESKEAKGLLREFLGDENCHRREMALQVHQPTRRASRYPPSALRHPEI